MNRGPAGEWSDDDVKIVKDMWQEGASATDIAQALGGGKTRSAVLGKIHRLKLPVRPQDLPYKRGAHFDPKPKTAKPLTLPKIVSIIAKPSGQKQRKVAPPMAGNANAKRMIIGAGPVHLDMPPLPIRSEAFMPLPGSAPVPIIEHADGCRWPVGDPALYCNLERATLPSIRQGREPTRSVYCKVHDALSKPPAGKRLAR